jgi:hypothetical protein
LVRSIPSNEYIVSTPSPGIESIATDFICGALLAHTCNVWAVCVYVLEAAARGVYFSLARLKKNYWADFNVI